jgi:hypothetical protein
MKKETSVNDKSQAATNTTYIKRKRLVTYCSRSPLVSSE